MRIQDSLSLTGSKPNTRWLRAYMLGYFIALFVSTGVDTLSLAYLYFTGRLYAIYFAATLLPTLLCLGTGIMAFLGMKNLTRAGYQLNTLHLGCTAFYFASTNAIKIIRSDTGLSLGYVVWLAILTVVFAAVWFFPNYAYFKKRRELFCGYSKEEIVAALSKRHDMLHNSQITALLKESGKDVRWMRLYLNAVMPVLAAFAVLSLASLRLFPSSLLISAAQTKIGEMLLTIFSYISPAIAIFTFFHLRTLSPAGYRWNIIFLWEGFLAWLVRTAVEYYPLQIQNPFRIPLLGTFILTYLLIWVLPNLFYFKKRKELFRTYADEEIRLALRPRETDPFTPKRAVCHHQPSKVHGSERKIRHLEQ